MINLSYLIIGSLILSVILPFGLIGWIGGFIIAYSLNFLMKNKFYNELREEK